MGRLSYIVFVVISIVLFGSCSKVDSIDNEMKTVKNTDKLIARHPAQPNDIDVLVKDICKNMVVANDFVKYEHGVMCYSSFGSYNLLGIPKGPYLQLPMNLIFFDDGTVRKCYYFKNGDEDCNLYKELKWSYDINTMSIRLVDEDLVARGYKNAETALRLRYYGDDMYILDGLMPTPENYDDKDCMYRYFIDKTKTHDRQWYLDNCVDEKMLNVEN